jgi:hypothetical protein
MLVSWLAYSIEKMEEKFSSKTSAKFQQSTWLYVPEDGALHDPCCENVNYAIPHKICVSAQLQKAELYFFFPMTLSHIEEVQSRSV